MAATQTVPQYPHGGNFSTVIAPRNGVVTLFGYGIRVLVERGHLALEDGIGSDRRQARLSRVGHGLRRLVVIGSDGMVSLAALRWLADQDAAFVMLERDGTVLATTGPVRSSDARLRRAQAFAEESGAAVQITKELISQKLVAQEQVAREKLGNLEVADSIAQFRSGVESANTVIAIRQLESQAAKAYWSAWRKVQIVFPRNDLRRIPDHWKTFGTRESPLTNSPRLAEKQRSHRLAERTWKPEDKPDWLDDKAYVQQIHPRLADLTISTIALTLGVSFPYASDIRAGRSRPHPRHWLTLARLVAFSGPN